MKKEIELIDGKKSFFVFKKEFSKGEIIEEIKNSQLMSLGVVIKK